MNIGEIGMAAEKIFETKIKRFLKDEGCWVVKYFANAYTPSGIPDLLCCVNGQFVAVEVKAQNGKPSLLQHFNCDEIIDAGGCAFILYPSGFEKFKENIHRLKNKQGLAYPEKILK